MSSKKGCPVRYFDLIVICLLCLVPAARADQRVCGGDTVVARAAVGQAVEIVLENGVGDLVRSGDPSTLKVEHTSGHLFITPLSLSPAQVSIIDMRGQSHWVRCVFDQPPDQKIVIRDCGVSDAVDKRQDAAMALMRDLIRGRTPEGAAETKADAVMFDDGRVRMRSVLMEDMPRLCGHVMVVENLTSGPVAVPVQRMVFPGLLAVASSRDVLAPGERGQVYMVVGR